MSASAAVLVAVGLARQASCARTVEQEEDLRYNAATWLRPVIDASNLDDGLELRLAAVEGMLDAFSGEPYADDYGSTSHGTMLALAYCGGYCLVAPGRGHAATVAEIKNHAELMMRLAAVGPTRAKRSTKLR